MKLYKLTRTGNAEYRMDTAEVVEEGEHFWTIRESLSGRDDGYRAVYKKKDAEDNGAIWGWYETTVEAITAQREMARCCFDESRQGVVLRTQEMKTLRKMLELKDAHKRKE